MEGITAFQTINGYVPQAVNNRSFSAFRITTGVKQKKAAPSIKDNRQLLSEQMNLLETIQGRKVTESVTEGVIQGRIPNFTELDALHHQMKPEIIREKVKILLRNLQLEGLILQGENVNHAVDSLIEDDGKVNQVYYEQLFGKADGTEDKNKVYHRAEKSKTKLEPGEEANLRTMLQSAKTTVAQTIPCEKKLQEVFGENESKDAKDNYKKITKKLDSLSKNLAKRVTTDYNGDDSQLGVGGYAIFDRQDMHIMQDLCRNVNSKGITTAIHECAHLADKSIKDLGYMGTPGFENMLGDRKVRNAAHYEVIPSWILGMSIPYPVGHTFIPHNRVGAAGVSELTLGKKDANDYFEKAWIVAVNLSMRLKNLYSNKDKIEKGNALMATSEKLSLTIHQNTDRRVSLLDVTLMQEKARTLSIMMRELKMDNENVVTPNVGREVYKFHFINKIIANNQREGLTSSCIDYLYRWGY